MVDQSSGLFQYSGKKYLLAIVIYPDAESNDAIPLENKQIEEFEYTTEINQLFYKGSITCTDSHGRLDRLIGSLNSICQVYFVRMLDDTDGQITVERESKSEVFSCGFLIQNAYILERSADTIKYKIELVSDSVLRCMRNLSYSNYDKKKESVLDIFKACCIQAGFAIDKSTFDAIKSDVKINYITNGNDNLISVFRYLFNRMFYYKTYDKSMKFAFYNESTDKCQLFDLMNTELAEGGYNIILSLMNTPTEQMSEEEQAKISTITRVPRTQYIDIMFNETVNKYDYEKNKFDKDEFNVQQKENFINKTPIVHKDIQEKYIVGNKLKDEDMKTYGFIRRLSYWNEDQDKYGSSVKNLLKNNALLVETSGEILRKPSSITNLAIDRNIDEHATDEDTKKAEDIMKRYAGFEGSWYTMRVHHIIQPNKPRYRQVLALVRNFNYIPKTK